MRKRTIRAILSSSIHKIAHRFTLPEPSTNPPPRVVSDFSNHPHSVASSQDPGETTFAGIDVAGTLRTYRTPVGANGNDRELIETTESWYAPGLHVIVRAKVNSATQNLEWELTHLSRDEPDQSLFEIPKDYTVEDDKAAVTITVTQP